MTGNLHFVCGAGVTQWPQYVSLAPRILHDKQAVPSRDKIGKWRGRRRSLPWSSLVRPRLPTEEKEDPRGGTYLGGPKGGTEKRKALRVAPKVDSPTGGTGKKEALRVAPEVEVPHAKGRSTKEKQT